jgi:hypothetical protein
VITIAPTGHTGIFGGAGYGMELKPTDAFDAVRYCEYAPLHLAGYLTSRLGDRPESRYAAISDFERRIWDQ